LTTGRRDASGDFQPGWGFGPAQADLLLEAVRPRPSSSESIAALERWFAVAEFVR
jgi:hypothetical protein